MSKGLEALERIGAEKLARGELIRNDSKVEPYYETIEKELKALEIIRNKFVMTGYILSGCPLKEYNSCIKKQHQLTQEEYDLLKEVLQ